MGIRPLEEVQQAYSLKLWWKMQNGVGIWPDFMRAKYKKGDTLKERLTDSSTWKRICRIDETAAAHIFFGSDRTLWNGGPFTLKKAYEDC
ncbi:unnamed protein product [Cuscuta campestris]|uniref:Uncharacterized protein n=1 Tax=Cuscuta campestris TaxID=132261 RepID=A0A484NNR9_9ASTE|nr:unnamed protein product [Cuscuta campestris]